MRVGIPIADLTAGIFCSQGIMLALLERERTGKGQWVQTSLLQAQVFMLDFQASRWLMDKEVPPQAGNDHPTSIPTGVFKTSDGHINIAVAGQKMWEKFKSLFDDPALQRSRLRRRQVALEEPQDAQRADREPYCRRRRRPSGSRSSMPPVRPPARSTTSARCSPSSRSATSGLAQPMDEPGARQDRSARTADPDVAIEGLRPPPAADARPAHGRDPRRDRLRHRGRQETRQGRRHLMRRSTITDNQQGSRP